MIRRIVNIDTEKCNGCGLCAEACHEGAISMRDGKAVLLRDELCDGIGDCLPACPAGAIRFEERTAAPYDERAVREHFGNARSVDVQGGLSASEPMQNGCDCLSSCEEPAQGGALSELRNWPVQIRLAPVDAPYFAGANLLIAADCTAYARADFHTKFMRGRVTLIGCPKLDGTDYSVKLTELFACNKPASVLLARMSVPCCGGLERAVCEALARCGAPSTTRVTLSPKGEISAGRP